MNARRGATGPHEHVWQRYQNTTPKGTVLPPYEVCSICNTARVLGYREDGAR